MAALLSAALVVLPNRFLPPLPPEEWDPNELHALWIVRGKGYFVEKTSAVADASGSRVLGLHPELVFLDNGDDTFLKEKPEGAYRIFCIGGSTTRGWPFHRVGVSYPRLLSLYLGDLLPGRKVEIINAGLMASDSFSDLRLVREILNYDPDLLLVYEGRNDPWNWRLHVGPRANILRAHFWALRELRLYEFAYRRFLKDPREKFNKAAAVREWALSGRPSRGDEARRLRHIVDNLEAMAALARRKRCRIVVMTQVAHPEEASLHLINDRVRAFARREGVPLADVDRAFRDDPRPLEALLIPPPPVHPDLAGYALMARTVARSLAENDIIAPAAEWGWGRLRSDEHYHALMGLTDPALRGVYLNLSGVFESLGQTQAAERYLERSKRRVLEQVTR